MENVYDVRYRKSLSYIVPTNGISNPQINLSEQYKASVVILYFYYEDKAETYFKYIDNIPEEIHLYIISSLDLVLDIFRVYVKEKGRINTTFILKENRGRDISALLISANNIVRNYKYVCFVHDKKEHKPEMKADIDLWNENLWGNMLASGEYIAKILQMFEANQELGILAPPDPVGDYFRTWYGYGWHGAFEATRQLAEKMKLNADLDSSKPPVTIGTALWFRTNALLKLFDANWMYSDFIDDNLRDANYLSYGIERIFAYVAQDAGYDTGEIMTLEYAQKQNNYLHYSTAKIFSAIHSFFPLSSVKLVEQYEKNLPGLLDFAAKYRKLFLYGAGERGRFCLAILRKNGIEVEAFLVSDNTSEKKIDALPVLRVDCVDLFPTEEVGIVITVASDDAKNEIKKKLKVMNFCNWFELWQ